MVLHLQFGLQPFIPVPGALSSLLVPVGSIQIQMLLKALG